MSPVVVIAHPDVFLGTMQRLDAWFANDRDLTLVMPQIAASVARRNPDAERFLESRHARIRIDRTYTDLGISDAFLRNSGIDFAFMNAQIREPGRKMFIVPDDWLELNQVPADDRLVWIRVSDVVGLDYFKLAHAHGQPVCFGCGLPDPGPMARPSWAAIHDHLKKFGYWKAEDIAVEANRYRVLCESGIPVVLCDDCWNFGYGWSPGEAELLHSRARRFANETMDDYRRRQSQRARWDKAAGKERRKVLLPAALRWDHIWLLNNPGSELPYEAVP